MKQKSLDPHVESATAVNMFLIELIKLMETHYFGQTFYIFLHDQPFFRLEHLT